MRTSTIKLPQAYYKLLDELVRDGYYPSKAEAIREAVRALLHDHGKFAEWLAEKRKHDEVLNEVMERGDKSEQ